MSYWAVTDQFVVIEFEVINQEREGGVNFCTTRLTSHSTDKGSHARAWWKKHFQDTYRERLTDRSDVWNSEVGAVAYAIEKLREKKAEVMEQAKKLSRLDCDLTQRLSDAFGKEVD